MSHLKISPSLSHQLISPPNNDKALPPESFHLLGSQSFWQTIRSVVDDTNSVSLGEVVIISWLHFEKDSIFIEKVRNL